MSRDSDTHHDDDDLFAGTRMTIGQHLEELRHRLIRAVLGVVVALIVALFFGKHIVKFLQIPIEDALARYDQSQQEPPTTQAAATQGRPVRITLRREDLKRLLEAVEAGLGDRIAVDAELEDPDVPQPAPVVRRRSQLTSLSPTEPFLAYLRVSFFSGLILAAPWIFIQIWGFIAAGLYRQEKRFSYTLLPLCLLLFVGGVVFCFLAVFPVVLEFLLWFNKWLDVAPQMRLSEWLGFAVQLPLVFGLAFQLPLVMLLLDRSGFVKADTFRAKRRHAIVICFIVAMLLTPPDPASQIMMALPLVFLYELGLLLARMRRGGADDAEADVPGPPSSSEPLAG